MDQDAATEPTLRLEHRFTSPPEEDTQCRMPQSSVGEDPATVFILVMLLALCNGLVHV